MWYFPLDRQKHEEVLQQLDRHDQDQDATDPLTQEQLPPPKRNPISTHDRDIMDHFTLAELQSILESPNGVDMMRRRLFTTVIACSVVIVIGVVGICTMLTRVHDPKDSTLPAMLVLCFCAFLVGYAFYNGVRLYFFRELQSSFPQRGVVESHIAATHKRWVD